MAIKKSLLEIVQDILSDMDSEEVNSIADTLESDQVARVVETTYYDLIADRDIPEHYGLIKLTALSDSLLPTHFTYPDNTKYIDTIHYDTSDDETFEYTEVKWMEPLDFIRMLDSAQSDYTSVKDVNGGTNLRIRNDKHPQWYTSFDDEHVVMDSYKSTVDTTLQESKVRAFGSTFPVFSKTDDYVPDIDPAYFPYLIAESKSTAQSLFKGGSDPKTEQKARRHKSYIQNDKFNNNRGSNWNAYGRHHR